MQHRKRPRQLLISLKTVNIHDTVVRQYGHRYTLLLSIVIGNWAQKLFCFKWTAVVEAIMKKEVWDEKLGQITGYVINC